MRLKELQLDGNKIHHVPSAILLECRSLHTLSLNGNPMSITTLEETEGFEAFERRRAEKASKAISSQVMLGETTLSEPITRRT